MQSGDIFNIKKIKYDTLVVYDLTIKLIEEEVYDDNFTIDRLAGKPPKWKKSGAWVVEIVSNNNEKSVVNFKRGDKKCFFPREINANKY